MIADTGRRPKILLFTTINWASTAQLGLALARQGFQVATMAPFDHGVRKVRAIAQHFASLSYAASDSYVARTIMRWEPDFVVPCDDRAVACLHDVHAQAARSTGDAWLAIRTTIERSLGDPSAFAIAQKKSKFLAFAQAQGLRVPPTIVVSDRSQLERALTQISGPYVLKVDGTSSGLGVRIVETPTEAREAYRQLLDLCGWSRATLRALKTLSLRPLFRHWYEPTAAVTIQPYIEGTPANRATLCWEGEVLAGLSVEALRTDGATGPATVVRVVDHPEMAEAARRIVKSLGLSGFIGLDFIVEAATGRAVLLEMNARPTQICHFSLDDASDMTGTLLARLTGTAKRPVEPAAGSGVIALFPGESWRDPQSAFLQSCYHDVPLDEPQLVSAYSRPPVAPNPLAWVSQLCSRVADAFPLL
ncbi:MAG TPA: ATP-grasp domain-containing protein [Candidatus Acidoferrales bacterium]|nr:ATP-grasp domain-containing protein [Candidatus Acidoferrales bacterium]